MFSAVLRSSLYRLLPLLLIGCATGSGARGSGAPDIVISVAEQNARIGDEMFPVGDNAALRAALGGACAAGCDSIEIQPTPGASYAAVRTVYEAGRRTTTGDLRLRFAWKATAGSLRTGALATEAKCATEIVAVENAMYLYVDGNVLRPDKNCDEWSATVCRTAGDGAGSYDWSELARRVKERSNDFSRGVCVDLLGDTPASTLERIVATVNEGLPEETEFVLTTGKKAGEVPDEAIASTVNAAAKDFTSCYQDATGKTAVAMQAATRFVIHSSGGVARAGIVTSTGTTPEFEQCIVDVLSSLRFPPPTHGGNVVVDYPLNFTPR